MLGTSWLSQMDPPKDDYFPLFRQWPVNNSEINPGKMICASQCAPLVAQESEKPAISLVA